MITKCRIRVLSCWICDYLKPPPAAFPHLKYSYWRYWDFSANPSLRPHQIPFPFLKRTSFQGEGFDGSLSKRHKGWGRTIDRLYARSPDPPASTAALLYQMFHFTYSIITRITAERCLPLTAIPVQSDFGFNIRVYRDELLALFTVPAIECRVSQQSYLR